VTEEVLVDNQKTAVLFHSQHTGPQFTPRFVDLADYYGFVPRACKPYGFKDTPLFSLGPSGTHHWA
jgi:transposase